MGIDTPLDFVAAILVFLGAVVASSGFWMYVMKRSETKDLRNRLLMGLAHDRIMYLARTYIERNWITQDEYENLHEYLYVPYSEMGGNGSAKRMITEIDKLQIRTTPYIEPKKVVKCEDDQ